VKAVRDRSSSFSNDYFMVSVMIAARDYKQIIFKGTTTAHLRLMSTANELLMLRQLVMSVLSTVGEDD
jgi:hypothetical protein